MTPVYITRREKFRNGLLSIVAGVVVYTKVPLLGQLLVAVGFWMIASGIIHGEERIA